MNSLDILSLLADKEHYERFSPFIKEHLVGKEAYTIIRDVGGWFENHPALTWSSFSTWFFMVKHPMFKPEKVEYYQTIFDKLETHEPNEDLIEELIEHFIGKDYATKISEAALSIVEGSTEYDIESISTLLDEYNIELDKAAELDSFLVSDDDSLLLEEFERTGGLNWRLNELQEAVGNILRGDFVVVSAYVGAGKTTMLCSEAVHMASQIEDDEHVVWFLNEERGMRVKRRLAQSATGMSDKEILANPKKFLEAWKAHPARKKVKIYDRAQLQTNDMEQMLKRYKPGLIIFDQLFKCHFPGKSKDNEVERIASMFNWGREIAKKYAPVITVHQADGTSVGQMWIEQSQLHMSRVGIQGEMDVIVTLGRDLTGKYPENIRGLYTPKNKLSGNEGYKAFVELNTDKACYQSCTEEFEL